MGFGAQRTDLPATLSLARRAGVGGTKGRSWEGLRVWGFEGPGLEKRADELMSLKQQTWRGIYRPLRSRRKARQDSGSLSNRNGRFHKPISPSGITENGYGTERLPLRLQRRNVHGKQRFLFPIGPTPTRKKPRKPLASLAPWRFNSTWEMGSNLD